MTVPRVNKGVHRSLYQLLAFAVDTLALLATSPLWTMAAFDTARAPLERRHPEGWGLWRALKDREKL